MGTLIAGRFVLEERIGGGGMGSVWLAWDGKQRCWVAAKLLSHTNATMVLRFVREQSLRIVHPHVVAPTGWAADDDRVVLSMELVRGARSRPSSETMVRCRSRTSPSSWTSCSTPSRPSTLRTSCTATSNRPTSCSSRRGPADPSYGSPTSEWPQWSPGVQRPPYPVRGLHPVHHHHVRVQLRVPRAGVPVVERRRDHPADVFLSHPGLTRPGGEHMLLRVGDHMLQRGLVRRVDQPLRRLIRHRPRHAHGLGCAERQSKPATGSGALRVAPRASRYAGRPRRGGRPSCSPVTGSCSIPSIRNRCSDLIHVLSASVAESTGPPCIRTGRGTIPLRKPGVSDVWLGKVGWN